MSDNVSNGGPRRHIVGPLILIVLGLLLLLQNLGLLPWGLWSTLWRLWPLLLILLGMELVFGRSNPWTMAVIALVVVALAIGGAFLYTSYYYVGWVGSQGGVQHLSQDLNGLQRARVEIRFGAGDLTIASLSNESPLLMEGDFQGRGPGRRVDREFQSSAGEGTLRLSSRRDVWLPFEDGAANWDVKLTPRLPLDLRLQVGACRMNLDLKQLNVQKMRLNVGASSGEIRLPEQAGQTMANIKAGAADLTVEIPKGVAARIKSKEGLSSIDVDEGRFPRSGAYYISPGYDQAQNRLDLEIDSGVAHITIR
ncbi:MAG: toast rack family protein [Chloroflexi bacterium]|nr:toast rack family protein [Chloroflexota bacterium]